MGRSSRLVVPMLPRGRHPRSVRAYRGTTSLAAGVRTVAGAAPATAHRPAVTGQTRPVLIRPPAPRGPHVPFFRGLPGDSRINAFVPQAYPLRWYSASQYQAGPFPGREPGCVVKLPFWGVGERVLATGGSIDAG